MPVQNAPRTTAHHLSSKENKITGLRHYQFRTCTTHACMHSCLPAHTHAHHSPVCSLLCISLPKCFILGLPCTLMIMSHATLKASQLHFCLKHSSRARFLAVLLNASVIHTLSLWLIMFFNSSSHTTAIASISAMYWPCKSLRTFPVAWKGKNHDTQTCQRPCCMTILVVHCLYTLLHSL